MTFLSLTKRVYFAAKHIFSPLTVLLLIALTTLTACGEGDSGADTIAPVITLNGTNTVNHNYGAVYSDLGATATDDIDGSVTVTTTGSVNVDSIGSYTLTYTASDAAGNQSTAQRTVNVVDTIAPVITLIGTSTVDHNYGDIYNDSGATATDYIDGSITVTTTGSVNVDSIGSYTLIYSATDAAGNQSTAQRTVTVSDLAAPVITLNGESTINHNYGHAYNDLGATATDYIDGSVTVTMSGTVNVNALGSYSLTYTASDAAGNQSTAQRIVNVIDTIPPVITSPANISIQENSLETGLTPSAIDAENNNISFSLQGDDASYFVLDNETGELVFLREPDFELPLDNNADNVYQLTLTATDTAGNETNQLISVEVLNALSDLQVVRLYPTAGSDVGRGYNTTTTVAYRFAYIDLENMGESIDVKDVTNATANGVALSETYQGAGVWIAEIDVDAGENSLVIKADIASESTLLSDSYSFNNFAPIKSPRGLAIDPENSLLYVVDRQHDALIKVDLITKHREVVADTQTWGGSSIFWPNKLRLYNSNSNILISDSWGSGELFDVDLTTGERNSINSRAGAAHGLAVNADETQVLVAAANYAAIYAVDINTGAKTQVADGAELGWPYDIEANTEFDQYLVASQRPSSLLTFNPITGDKEVVASSSIGSGDSMGAPNALTYNADDGLYLVGDSYGVLAFNASTKVRSRLLNSEYSVQDLVIDSANDRILLAGSGRIMALNSSDLSETTFIDGKIGEGEHFSWARSVLFDSIGNNLYVGDTNTIYRVDLENGDREVVSGTNIGSGPTLGSMYDLALDSETNTLYATNLSRLFSIDIETGKRTIISSSSVGSGPSFSKARGLALDANSNTMWLVDYGIDAVIQVDLTTGNRKILSDSGTGSGSEFTSPFGIILDSANNRLLVANGSNIIAVNISTGNRTVISDGSNAGPQIGGVRELSLGSSSGNIYVISNATSQNRLEIISINPNTGDRSLVSNNVGDAGVGPSFIDTQGISVDEKNNRLFIMDSGDGTGALLNISIETGDRTILSQ